MHLTIAIFLLKKCLIDFDKKNLILTYLMFFFALVQSLDKKINFIVNLKFLQNQVFSVK